MTRGTLVEAVLRLGEEPEKESDAVAVTRINTGAVVESGPPRAPLPSTPV